MPEKLWRKTQSANLTDSLYCKHTLCETRASLPPADRILNILLANIKRVQSEISRRLGGSVEKKSLYVVCLNSQRTNICGTTSRLGTKATISRHISSSQQLAQSWPFEREKLYPSIVSRLQSENLTARRSSQCLPITLHIDKPDRTFIAWRVLHNSWFRQRCDLRLLKTYI